MNNNFNFDGFNEFEARERAFDVYPAEEGDSVTTDDGFLHVSRGGNRFAFDLGQELSSREFNRQANEVLEAIGVVGQLTGNNN